MEVRKDILFPDNEIYDDFMIAYRLYHKSRKVIYLPIKKYCLIEEKNIKTHDSDCMKKINGCIEMLKFIESEYPELVNFCKVKICCEAIFLFNKVEDINNQKELYEYIKLYRKYAIKNTEISTKIRKKVTSTLLGFNILYIKSRLERN